MMTGVLLLERSVHIERRETEELAVGRTLVFAVHPDGGALCSFHVPRPRVAWRSLRGVLLLRQRHGVLGLWGLGV